MSARAAFLFIQAILCASEALANQNLKKSKNPR
jgi:hypothetical protein